MSGDDLTMEIAQSLYEEAIATCQDVIAMPPKQALKRTERIKELTRSERLPDRLAVVLYQQYLKSKKPNV